MNKQIRRSDDEWMDIITESRSSGLTDADWCRTHDISIHTFYNAVRRLRNKACCLPDHSERCHHRFPESHEIVKVGLMDDTNTFMNDASLVIQPNYTVAITVGSTLVHFSNSADLNFAEQVIRLAERLSC